MTVPTPPAASLEALPASTSALRRELRFFVEFATAAEKTARPAYSAPPDRPTFAQLTRDAFYLAYLLAGHCVGGQHFEKVQATRAKLAVYAAAWLLKMLEASTPLELARVLPIARGRGDE